MPTEYSPETPVAPTTYLSATIPALADDADIVVAFSDYHDNISWYINDSVSKTRTASQTIASPVTLSGATITISGATVAFTGTTLNVSSAATFSGTVAFTNASAVSSTNGFIGDLKTSNGTVVADNGTAASLDLSGTSMTGYNASFYGTAAAARSAVLYKAAPGTGTNNYSAIDGVRRIFVGANQPTGPSLQAGDIWMW